MSNIGGNSQANPQKTFNQDTLMLNNEQMGNEESDMFPMISASSNPFVAAIHILLKVVILAMYLIIPLFSQDSSALQFVVIAAAADFWIIKNISGRLLVGLRWWVDFDEKGDEQWKFECKVNEKDINVANDKIFWWILALFALIWTALVIINIVRLNVTHISITAFCAAMLIFNLYSYYRCSKVQSQNIKKLAYQYGGEVAGQFMRGAIVAKYF